MHEDALNEGLEKGKELAQTDFVQNCLARGMSIKETAELTNLSVAQVRRIARQHGKKK